jgi:hypothetical protein
MEDLQAFDHDIAALIRNRPMEYIPVVCFHLSLSLIILIIV